MDDLRWIVIQAVKRLPDEALTEALSVLSEMRQFYNDKAAHKPVPPPPLERFPVTFSREYESPVFPINPEDYE